MTIKQIIIHKIIDVLLDKCYVSIEALHDPVIPVAIKRFHYGYLIESTNTIEQYIPDTIGEAQEILKAIVVKQKQIISKFDYNVEQELELINYQTANVIRKCNNEILKEEYNKKGKQK